MNCPKCNRPTFDHAFDCDNYEVVFDIPVLVQVRARREAAAATILSEILADAKIVGDGWQGRGEIESWHMPNHKYADGSDEPVRVEVVPV